MMGRKDTWVAINDLIYIEKLFSEARLIECVKGSFQYY